MMENHEHSLAPGVLHKPLEHTALKVLSWAGLATAGLALAPVVGRLFGGGVGQAASGAITFCTTGAAKGLAGSVSGLLNGLPVIGGTSIVAGGFATAATSGALAIGGMWLGNYVDKHTQPGNFRWGAVIRWASLATSILIALPAILPAISMGLMFAGLLMGPPNLLTATAGAIGSLGAAGAMSGVSSAMGGAGLALVHALTCALPLGSAGLFLGKAEPKEPRTVMVRDLPIHYDGRLTPPRMSQLAVAS